MGKKEFYTLPQAMYDLNVVRPILSCKNNAILHKKLSTDMLDMEKVILSHTLVYIKSGRVKLQTYDYEEFILNEGEMLFMPRDRYLISDYINTDKQMDVHLFFFDHTLTNEFLQSLKTEKLTTKSTITKLNLSQNISNYIDTLADTHYKNRTDEALLKIKLFELLHLVAEVNENFISLLQAHELQKKETDIKTYMLKHYDKKLTVDEWAMLSGYSLSTFTRRFKKETGSSPKKWLIEQNMHMANRDLKDGMNVSECAAEYGYANTSNFIKAYKEIFHKTPKQHTMT